MKHLHRKTTLAVAFLALFQPLSASAETSYLDQVGHKFERGFSNLFTGLGEVPKNVLVNSEKTNYVTGGTGGIVSGTLDTLGRTSAGIFDVVTSPIPTASLVQPEFVWDDFDKASKFGLDLPCHSESKR